MAFGVTPKDTNGIPISSVYVPGTGFVALQGSTLNNTDGSSNTSTSVPTVDALLETMRNAQCFRAHFQNTIGGAAQGFYGMSLYNASGSGKSVLVTAVRGWVNGNAPLMYAFKATTNPAMGNTATAVNDNLGSATASVVTMTYNTASGGVSFPGTTNIASISQPTNGTAVLQSERGGFVWMPSGTALSLECIMFVVNSAQYGIQFEWTEF